jgi:hypothetical protein
MYPGRADMLCPSAIGRFGPIAEVARPSNPDLFSLDARRLDDRPPFLDLRSSRSSASLELRNRNENVLCSSIGLPTYTAR